MRRQSSRYISRRRKSALIDLDITSLLDILTILLAFLIHNFDATGVIVHVPEGITLPESKSDSPNKTAISIQVSAEKIWVENKEIVSSQLLPRSLYDATNRRINPLYDELVRIREKIQLTSKLSGDQMSFTGKVNLVMDKSLKYNYLKKILFTCAEAGYKEYNFLVQAKK
jgi:biopolymer transport protein ExbD